MYMSPEEQLEILRYWIFEGSFAIDDVAFIEKYEQVRARYVAERRAKGLDLRNPWLNSSGRIAQQRLFQARTTLVIFCCKAMDQDNQSASLGKLKNSILRNDNLCNARRNRIIQGFRHFQRNHGSDERIKSIRDKIFAHSDLNEILQGQLPKFNLRELIEYSRAVTTLIATLADYSALVPKGTAENPIVSDNSLVLQPVEIAEMDALEFWEKNFDEWS